MTKKYLIFLSCRFEQADVKVNGYGRMNHIPHDPENPHSVSNTQACELMGVKMRVIHQEDTKCRKVNYFANQIRTLQYYRFSNQ